MSKYYLIREETPFTRSLRALNKYNKLVYKEILFKVLPDLGLGKHAMEGTNLRIDLSCDDKFTRIYGQLYLSYSVKDDVVIVHRVEPYTILNSLYSQIYATSKGVPVLSERDRFKILLFDKLDMK